MKILKSNRIGLLGILIALIGVSVAVLQDDLRLRIAPDSPKLIERVAVKGIKLFGNTAVEEDKHDAVDFLYIGLGLVAFALAAVSYITNENHRISATAAALGIIALAWQYVLIGLIIAVVVFFLASFS